ncbi:MAG: hypothetical protein HUU16_12225 [Candidatus Omnitrophica bacterium]|nr:hypothetical protein [Candidatus Omnitrophota bacterium]
MRGLTRAGVALAAIVLAALVWGERPRAWAALDPNALNRQGAEATARGDHAKAVECFRQARALEPDQTVLRYNLFHALNNYSIEAAGKGEVAEAIRACSEALSLVPDDVRVASNLAIFFHNRATKLIGERRYEEAREALAHAHSVVTEFRLDNLAPTLRESLARSYLIEGRERFERNEVSQALDLYGRCIQINPDEALAYLDRSRIFYEQDFFQDAISDLELAAQILGQTPQITALLSRIKVEAKQKGQDLAEQDAYFRIEATGGSPHQEQPLKRALKELRLAVARNLTVNPKSPILVSIKWNEAASGPEQWMATPGNRFESDTIPLGASGVEIGSEEFRLLLEFHYLGALALNLGGASAPYWFAAGLAQYRLDGTRRLSPAESEELLAAGENFLLFDISDLSLEKVPRIEDGKLLSLAYLECKALVEHLVKSIGMNGLRQLMRALSEGVPFDHALRDVANLTVLDIQREWRASLGLPTN